MNNSTLNDSGDMRRWGLTLVLGMLVTLWRVVLPTNIEITTGVVILVAALDIILTTILIFINRKELREAFMRKFKVKDFLKIIIGYVLLYLCMVFIPMALNKAILLLCNVFPVMSNLIVEPGFSVIYMEAPAAWVGNEFSRVFPLGVSISMLIAAPIFEEITFRMAGRNLIKNTFLYVFITSWMFAFIHTCNFFAFSNINYFIYGLVFALIYFKTKDLRITMAIHFLNNLVALILGFI